MECFKFPREKKKAKPSFIRRMTTFARGSPHYGRHAMREVINAALACNVLTLVGVGTSACFHECFKTHVRHVYDVARKNDRLLPRERLEAFLRETQGVDHIKLPDPQQYEAFTFDQFFQLWSNHDSAWRAAGARHQAPVDPTYPISSYFISSSHNTYLEGNQLLSRSSAEAYRAALRNGCRCIEIDVWNGPLARSPSKSPAPGHRRHFSSGSLPRLASEKLMSIRVSRQQSRSPSAIQKTFPSPLPSPDPRESATTLDPKDLVECRAKSRSSSLSNHTVEPVVHHHGTMTTTVGFREVCRAVRESAFERNPLPIIVSLEVGADQEQQEIMVKIMKEEWRGLLLERALDTCDNRQPRLEELYNKILIKVKRVKESPTDEEVERGRSLGMAAIRAKPRVCRELSKLAIYTHSEHYGGEECLDYDSPGHIFSLSEDGFLSLTEDTDKLDRVLAHNRDYFMRIYPKGSRIDSSNPDPTFHWRRGVQMVAMNWQKTDEGMMLNDAMFAGTNGWVLKPPSLLSNKTTTEMADMASDPKPTLDLRITVLAGQFLPLPGDRKSSGCLGITGDRKFQPKVKVELHVEKAHRSLDCEKETEPGCTEHPDWGLDPKSLDFLDVKNVAAELSFVRFKVEDYSSNFGGELVAWAGIRLDRLGSGFRCVDLLHPVTRRPCEGKLFVKIEKVWRE
ncbi:PLC-like phosphodiesterase [Parathielavia hyrcaniae]|uniref:Phosphoinositide phospholipase C n=1 Tax=Parathielavia hyrcaniae TaxID=113614 RepID=A0AAN6T2Y2_9PEZI|nr:PLC-like phosphodiesterase [Parathielavia hyrcaniae]